MQIWWSKTICRGRKFRSAKCTVVEGDIVAHIPRSAKRAVVEGDIVGYISRSAKRTVVESDIVGYISRSAWAVGNKSVVFEENIPHKSESRPKIAK